MTIERHIEKALIQASELGAKAGKSAAGWYEQDSWGGRVSSLSKSKDNARAFLKAYDDGDPCLYDGINLPSLSGEWAGDLTGPDLYQLVMGREAAGIDDQESFNDICLAWEEACNEAFWDHLVDSANSVISNN